MEQGFNFQNGAEDVWNGFVCYICDGFEVFLVVAKEPWYSSSSFPSSQITKGNKKRYLGKSYRNLKLNISLWKYWPRKFLI